ncbi:MAG: hypothetical protein U1F26_05035 [Lysobacterales bacterium]
MAIDRKDDELAAWLVQLTPAAGGKDRLRTALGRRRPSPWSYWSPTFAAIALCVLAVSLQPARSEADLRARLTHAWVQGDGVELAVSAGAAAPLWQTPALRIYWVAAAPEKNKTSSTTPSATR